MKPKGVPPCWTSIIARDDEEPDITGLKYFDPQRLQEIIGELGEQLQPLEQDKCLTDTKQTITLVDCQYLLPSRSK